MSERDGAHKTDGDTVDPANSGSGSAPKPSGQDVGPPGARVDDETPVSEDGADDAKRTHRQE